MMLTRWYRFAQRRPWLCRLIWAWRMRMWPWQVHPMTVRWIALDQRMTMTEQQHGQELAKRFGWERTTK